MTERLRELLAAGGITPGPWRYDGLDAFESFPSEVDAVVDGPAGLLVQVPTGVLQREGDHENVAAWAEAGETQATRDAAYIAACDPDTIRDLLDAHDRMAGALAQIIRELGPKAHAHETGVCEGCEYEINEALDAARAALGTSEEGSR